MMAPEEVKAEHVRRMDEIVDEDLGVLPETRYDFVGRPQVRERDGHIEYQLGRRRLVNVVRVSVRGFRSEYTPEWLDYWLSEWRIPLDTEGLIPRALVYAQQNQPYVPSQYMACGMCDDDTHVGDLSLCEICNLQLCPNCMRQNNLCKVCCLLECQACWLSFPRSTFARRCAVPVCNGALCSTCLPVGPVCVLCRAPW